MSERRMTQVVDQCKRLDQVFVQRQGPADRARNRGDFDRMGQPRAMVVAQLAGEDLRLGA